MDSEECSSVVRAAKSSSTQNENDTKPTDVSNGGETSIYCNILSHNIPYTTTNKQKTNDDDDNSNHIIMDNPDDMQQQQHLQPPGDECIESPSAQQQRHPVVKVPVPVGVPVAVPFPVKEHPLLPSSNATTTITTTTPSKQNGGNTVLHSGSGGLDNNNNNNNNDVMSPSSANTDQSFTDESLGDNNDMESLLPQRRQQQQHRSKTNTGRGGQSSGTMGEEEEDDADGGGSNSIHPRLTPLQIHMRDHGFDPNRHYDDDDDDNDDETSYLWGYIRPYKIGNMTILFPQYFHSSGWGVVGPHPFGPACVWLILVGSSHLCVHAAYYHQLGFGSVLVCYLFMALCTYRLIDVSLRDPGICLDKEIPSSVVGTDRADQYRYCDRCQCWQPPDGMHCVESGVCVAGYDHYCVWMGTCIGKNNYRQFVLFNISWLYYVGYAFFWLLTFGPIVMK